MAGRAWEQVTVIELGAPQTAGMELRTNWMRWSHPCSQSIPPVKAFLQERH